MKFAVATAALVVIAATPAAANSAGITGRSGKNGGSTCTQCHRGSNAPDITVEGLESGATLTAGGSIAFSVVVATTEGSSAGRFAGFNASTSNAGTLVAGTNARVQSGEATHAGKKAYEADGTVTFELELTDLQPGSHTLFVAANDVNGNGRDGDGDNAGVTTVTFTVGEGEGEGEGEPGGEGEGEGEPGEGEGEGEGTDEGGCNNNASSGTPGAFAMLGLFVAAVRRRRR